MNQQWLQSSDVKIKKKLRIGKFGNSEPVNDNRLLWFESTLFGYQSTSIGTQGQVDVENLYLHKTTIKVDQSIIMNAMMMNIIVSKMI